jgi:two-component sensor histidine kinase
MSADAGSPERERRSSGSSVVENLIVALLPKDRYPVLLRYGATLVIVGIAFLLRLSLEHQLASYPLLLFFPAVFLSALLFDKGSGFFATAASTLLVVAFFIPRAGATLVDPAQFLPLALFVAIGMTMAAVTEALRQAVQKLAVAQEQKTLRLEELAHRTKNDLNMIGALMALQARSQSEPAARQALESATNRIQVLAKAQDRLNGARDGGTIEVASFIEALCTDLGNLLRDVRPIVVRVHSDRLEMTSSDAVSVGLVVNELVTNALKHAFPGDRGGIVDVALSRIGEKIRIVVSDDGVGCPASVNDGLGSRLIRLMVRQMNGSVERTAGHPGCQVSVTIAVPSTAAVFPPAGAG